MKPIYICRPARLCLFALFALANLPAFAAEEAFEQKYWSLHAQATAVGQEHGAITSPYSGPNSLNGGSESHTSLTGTLYLGRSLWKNAEAYVDGEMAAGSGLSGTHGVAGFPNGEIYRVDNPKPKASLARVYLKQMFALGEATENKEDDLNQLARSVPQSRLTLIGGKFSLNDFFDDNTYSHDPRTQFLNWALMDNGAWDYAADTRGYTWGLFAELNFPNWAFRYARVMEPKEANQMKMDTNLAQAHADNFELEGRYKLESRPGKARLMTYVNHSHMGAYRTTINTPSMNMDVTQSRTYTQKVGYGLNVEQEVFDNIGAFARAGWNDGKTETWAFTEIDRTLSLGTSLNGKIWGRADDAFGLAILWNGLSPDHRDYLAGGGSGFILGDAQTGKKGLSYATENVLEAYCSWKVLKYLALSADFQYVSNPGMNRDRGPVPVFAARLHGEI
jgi:high affinity Mn2+ porin